MQVKRRFLESLIKVAEIGERHTLDDHATRTVEKQFCFLFAINLTNFY